MDGYVRGGMGEQGRAELVWLEGGIEKRPASEQTEDIGYGRLVDRALHFSTSVRFLYVIYITLEHVHNHDFVFINPIDSIVVSLHFVSQRINFVFPCYSTPHEINDIRYYP